MYLYVFCKSEKKKTGQFNSCFYKWHAYFINLNIVNIPFNIWQMDMKLLIVPVPSGLESVFRFLLETKTIQNRQPLILFDGPCIYF